MGASRDRSDACGRLNRKSQTASSRYSSTPSTRKKKLYASRRADQPRTRVWKYLVTLWRREGFRLFPIGTLIVKLFRGGKLRGQVCDCFGRDWGARYEDILREELSRREMEQSVKKGQGDSDLGVWGSDSGTDGGNWPVAYGDDPHPWLHVLHFLTVLCWHYCCCSHFRFFLSLMIFHLSAPSADHLSILCMTARIMLHRRSSFYWHVYPCPAPLFV